MKRGRRRLLTWLVIAVALGAAGSALLRATLPTPVEALARAATTREVASVYGTTLGTADAAFGGAGFGPGPTWYSINAWIGTIHQDDLALSGAGRAAPGAGMFGSLSADAVDDDGVLFLAMTSGTAAVDLRAAAIVWTHPSRRPVHALAVDGGRLYAAETHDVTARDAGTGRLLWSWPGGEREVATSVAVSEGLACFATGDAVFHVLSADDGRELHAVRLDRRVAGTIAATGTTAFVLTGPRAAAADLPLYAIDLARGRVAWRYDGPADRPLSAPRLAGKPVAGDGIVCFSSDDWFYALDAVTGAPRWKFQPRHDDGSGVWRQMSKFDALVRGATIRQGVVFASTADRTVGLAVEDGREVWRYDPAFVPVLGPAPFLAPRVRGNALLGVLGLMKIQAVPIDPQRLAAVPTAAPAPRAVAIRRLAILGALGAILAVAVAAIAMRRRRALIALTCCGLASVTAWAWARSYSSQDFIGQERRTVAGLHTQYVRRGIRSADGVVSIGATHEVWQAGFSPYAAPGDPTAWLRWTHEPYDRWTVAAHDAPPRLGLLHFDASWKSRASGTALGAQSDRTLTVPHGFVLLILLIPPLAWLTGSWRDRRRYPPGCCAACGYDLRANSGRCPECGVDVAPAAAR